MNKGELNDLWRSVKRDKAISQSSLFRAWIRDAGIHLGLTGDLGDWTTARLAEGHSAEDVHSFLARFDVPIQRVARYVAGEAPVDELDELGLY
jgi:hypothetical protein